MASIRRKLDVWVATLVFVLSVLFVVKGASYGPYYAPWTPNNSNDYKIELFTSNFPIFHYFVLPYLLRNTFLYLTYLLFVLKVIPDLKDAKRVLTSLALITVLCLLVALVVAFSNSYLQVYLLYAKNLEADEARYHIIFDAFVYSIGIFTLYGVFTFFTLKPPAKLLLKPNADIVISDCLQAFSIWIFVFSLLYVPGITNDYVPFWVCYVLFTIPVYAYLSLGLVPTLKKERLSDIIFNWRFFMVMIVSAAFVGIGLYFSNSSYSAITAFQYMGLAIVFHTLITTPATWFIYRYRFSKSSVVMTLQTALVNSTANTDFLRSQINPHFLFNTLNSIYGTAIQENSKRTALAIQKLGDIMRFMLYENYEEKILIEKEVEYIKNYIELQELRIAYSPNFSLDKDISDNLSGLYIAPMLLIPFIENAFKYGISRKFPSWIRIKINAEDNLLHFEILNSLNNKNNDLNKTKSGIGLENVKQRLALIYPDKHELAISETMDEFQVSLKLKLN